MRAELRTICNPLDLAYRYQHFEENGKRYACREGADPTLILFKGTYYLFVSMSAGFWYSGDLASWKFREMPDLLIYDYAPDVRQIGDYLYFCASRRGENCPILRTRDPLTEPFAQVSAPFDFWDPDLFWDDDGRVYLYWGCSNDQPIFGVEMDRDTMEPIGTPVPLIWGREGEFGFERPGENGESDGRPYIEGAFMTKHAGRYYLQYSAPGTEFNIYCEGVYVSDAPLGPFTLQRCNPFSSKPGGFITGAGHGSTIADKYGNYWHAATMRISMNHPFERRVGLFPAGFDEDGQLWCNQNFADYPVRIPEGKFDPASVAPEWMLLSYGKSAFASSCQAGSRPEQAVNEDIRNWWSAAVGEPGQWLCVDLGESYDVRAVQVNFADQDIAVDGPMIQGRRIELAPQISSYLVEYSLDAQNWTILETVSRECSNGYIVCSEGIQARYIRVTALKLPYNQPMRISGLRVFGNGHGEKPAAATAVASHIGPMDAQVRWTPVPGAQGYNVRYGLSPDKLYQSWLVYGTHEVKLATLMAGKDYYICVDSFNENGITPGQVFRLRQEITL